MSTAIVTGASSGIGAEFARQLAARGNNLILTARRGDLLAALASELESKHGIEVETVTGDLSDRTDIDRLVERFAAVPDLEFLINNAGFGVPGKYAEMDVRRNVAMVDVHVVATMRLTRAVLPGMIARRRGAVINVSSVAAFFPMPSSVIYSATKAFLNSFSRALAYEVAGSGVRVQALCPGFTHTGFHSAPEYAARIGEIPKWLWMNADAVVAGSLAALERGRVIYVPGAKNRALVAFAHSGLSGPLLKVFYRMRGQRL